jgi:signal transduction histidine kinase
MNILKSAFTVPQNLPLEVRVPSRLLMYFYMCATVANVLSMGYSTFVLGFEQPLVLEVLRLAFLLITALNVVLARRGDLVLAAALFGSALLGMSMFYTTLAGGMGAFVCMTMLPLVMLGFLPEKRPIFIMGIIFYVANISAHLWVSLAPAGAYPEPLYEFKVALMSYTIMMIATTLVTTLCSHINQVALARISAGTQELNEARKLVKQRSQQLGEAEVRAELTQRTKSRFLANMSHELRTPLNTIIGYADLLEEDFSAARLSDVHLEDVHRIRASGGQLLTLINDILDLSRIEAGKMPVMTGILPAHTLMEGAYELIVARHGHDLPVTLPTWPSIEQIKALTGLNLRGDEQLLQKALAHMVLERMLQGTVTIKATRAQDALCVECTLTERFADEVHEQLRMLHPQLSQPIQAHLIELMKLDTHTLDETTSITFPLA